MEKLQCGKRVRTSFTAVQGNIGVSSNAQICELNISILSDPTEHLVLVLEWCASASSNELYFQNVLNYVCQVHNAAYTKLME